MASPQITRIRKKMIVVPAVNADSKSVNIAIINVNLDNFCRFLLSIFIDIIKPAEAVDSVPTAVNHPAEKEDIPA
jgi:hypothetical protein